MNRIDVIAGGRPDAETITAIRLALRAVGGIGAGAGEDGTAEGPGSTPAWRRAALREGVGGAPMVAPDGLG